MSATTYDIIDRAGNVIDRNASLASAAREILGYDGNAYELRAADGGFELWHGRPGRLARTVIWSSADSEDAAEADIFAQVIGKDADWFGAEAVASEGSES